MTVYGYARVSTDGQSLAAQVSELKAAKCAKIFQEKISGARSDRKQLMRVITVLAKGDVLVVTRLDRLARSTRDLLNLLGTIAEKGAGFKSLRDTWADTTTAHGRLMLTILGGLAEFERELIRTRTGEGRERAKARGVILGRKPKLTGHQRREAIARREPGAVSRKSVLSMRARGSFDSQIPLRGYFLWVGGALLVLLFAADSLPAPLPSKLIEPHSTLPPIRITSELKGPEAVVIDTSRPGFLPLLPDKEIAAAPSQLLSYDVADAVRQPPLSLPEQADRSDGSPAIPTHVRETLAQLGPGVSDRAGPSRRRVGLARGTTAQFRSDFV